MLQEMIATTLSGNLENTIVMNPYDWLYGGGACMTLCTTCISHEKLKSSVRFLNLQNRIC